MPLTPGTRLGVYEITAQIGEGGMGQVHRAAPEWSPSGHELLYLEPTTNAINYVSYTVPATRSAPTRRMSGSQRASCRVRLQLLR